MPVQIQRTVRGLSDNCRSVRRLSADRSVRSEPGITVRHGVDRLAAHNNLKPSACFRSSCLRVTQRDVIRCSRTSRVDQPDSDERPDERRQTEYAALLRRIHVLRRRLLLRISRHSPHRLCPVLHQRLSDRRRGGR